MPANDVTITLTGRDNVSQTFRTVGRSAQDMGKSIDDAGKQADSTGARFSKMGAGIGAALTTASGLLSDFSQAAIESEASQARLDTAIENTGHTTLEYTDSLNAASKAAVQLGFDDEDAADAIAKMTTATGDANRAISDLSIAEDISRARKISLADASNIVIAAEQGRMGALNRMGIALDANASREERMDALQRQFAGNAQAYAETTAGSVDRVRAEFENFEETLGGVVNNFAPLISLLPGLAAGWTAAGAAIGAIVPEMEAATVASAALDLALGPVGIAAAAIAAVGAIVLFSHSTEDQFVPATDQANASLKDLNTTIAQFIQEGSLIAPLAKETGDNLTYIKNAAGNYETTLHDLQQAVTDAEDKQRAADNRLQSKTSPGYIQLVKNVNDAKEALRNYIITNDQNVVDANKLEEANKDVNKILTAQGPAAEAARTKLQQLNAQVESGAISWPQFVGGIIDAEAQLEKTATTADITAKRVTGLTGSLRVLGDQFTDLDGKALHAAGSVTELDTTVHTGGTHITGLSASTQVLGDQFTDLGGDSINAAKGIDTAGYASAAAAQAFMDAAAGIGVLDSGLDKLIAAGVSTWAERTASRVLNATDALSSMSDVVISTTNNIAGNSNQLNDWATKLINVRGTWGEIDDLLAHHRITLDQYNDAQEAQERIAVDNQRVQADTLVIQTKQAPLLADLADQQAKYYRQLAKMPAQQELVALGWMDQNEAAKANAALNLAAAAAAGTYGDAGEAAATKAITAQAQADPAFAAMLEDMGLISEGADGEITVNFPTAETVQEAVDNLTSAVEDMTAALLGVPPDVYTQIKANDEATSVIDAVRADLNALNGTTVYTSVYTTYIASGPESAPGYHPTAALGGMIDQPHHLQPGGMSRGWSWVGEAGPELIYAPGARVLPHTASVARTTETRAAAVTISGPITVIANDPRAFLDQMTAYAYGAQR